MLLKIWFGRSDTLNSKNSPDAGWNTRDIYHVTARNNPEIQIFTAEEEEEENPLDRKYYCALCGTKLQWLQGTPEWLCTKCGHTLDTSLQDVPIKDPNQDRVKVYQELDNTPVFDDHDFMTPFAQGIDVDELAGDSEDVELVKTSPDHRIQFLRVKGNMEQALNAEYKYSSY